MLRILHTADLHAGRPSPIELSRIKSGERRREVDRTIFRLVELAEKEGARLLLISGDMFEHLHQGYFWIKEVVSFFNSHPNIRVFISPGNHDPLLPDSLYTGIEWPPNVTIFKGGHFQEVVLEDLGLSVYGIGWTRFSERSRLLSGFKPRKKGSWRNILMIHGDLQRAGDSGSIYLPITLEDIENSCVDYVALGHIHAPYLGKIGDTVYAYPGCPEPLDMGDTGDRGVYLVDLSEGTFGSRVNPSFLPCSKRKVRRVEINVSNLETEEQIVNALKNLESPSAIARDIFEVSLVGIVDPSFEPHLEAIENELGEDFYSLKLVPKYTADYDIESLLSPDVATLEAKFVRRLHKLAKECLDKGDAHGARVASLAIGYGLDSLRLGRIIRRGK